MNKTIFIAALSLFIMGCGSADDTNTAGPISPARTPAPDVGPVSSGPISEVPKPKAEKLADLKGAAGAKAKEVSFWESKEITQRLEKLMKRDYAEMKKNWNTEDPAMVEGNIAMLTGCQATNCSSNQYIFIADLEKDNINVIHMKDGKVREYKEKGDIELQDSFKAVIEKIKANAK